MANSSGGIFDKILALSAESKLQLKKLDAKQHTPDIDSDLYDQLEDEKALVCIDLERETCQAAGIPYHGWAYNVFCCSRSRVDRQAMDLAKNIMDQVQNCAYTQLCYAMLGQRQSPYYELIWGCEPEKSELY